MNSDDSDAVNDGLQAFEAMPDFETLIDNMTPHVYEQLKRAVELGRWSSGVLLTQPQLESCMQAVIAYDHKHLPEEQRIGFIDRGEKSEGETCDSTTPDAPKPIRFLDS